jgi:hypothetical protein
LQDNLRHLFKLIILMLLGFLCSCSSLHLSTYTPTPDIKNVTPNIGDGGFLSGDSCGPPCFFGIIPGSTTKIDAERLLQSRGLNQDCKKFDNTKESGVRAIGCNSLIVILQNNIDIVADVGFQPSQQIMVEEVIAKYGEPSVVLMATIAPSNRQITAFMSLYFDNINTILGLAEQNSGMYQISPTTPVIDIKYLDNDEYKFHRRYVHSWNGYGVYQERDP